MYGDTEVMRKRAGQLREQASELRSLADSLVGQVETITLAGRAVTDLRGRVSDRAALLRQNAEQHELAAESLQRHVAEVDRLKEAIGDSERVAQQKIAEARNRIARLPDGADGVRVEPAESDRQLDQFEAPAPGHKDWLAVTLPGH